MSFQFVDGPFRGMDTTTAPPAVEPGYVRGGYNLMLTPGGGLTTRPGFQAQLTTPLSAPVYEALPFTYHGINYALLASGTNLYLWSEGASSVSALTGGPASGFDSGKVQFARLGNYVFATGAQGISAGKLYRLPIGTTVLEDAAGLITPTRTLGGAMVAQKRVDLPILTWIADKPASATLAVPDADFSAAHTGAGGGGASAPGFLSSGGWQATAGVVTVFSDSGAYWVQLDEPDSAILSQPIPNTIRNNAHSKTTNPQRRPIAFEVQFRLWTTATTQSVLVGCYAYADTAGTELLAELSQTIKPEQVQEGTVRQKVPFAFAPPVSDEQILSLRLSFTAGPENAPGGGNKPWITEVAVIPLPEQITATLLGGRLNVTGKVDGAGYPPGDRLARFAEIRLSAALGAATDFSSAARLAIPFYPASGLGNVSVRLGFLTGTSGSATVTYSDVLTLTSAATGDGQTGPQYLVADVSAIAASLTGITHLEFYFLEDLTLPDSAVANRQTTLFSLGALMDTGGLSPGYAPYEYRYREKKATEIVSATGNAVGLLTPSGPTRTAQVKVSGAVPENTGATIEWFRRGGTFSDNCWRKLAEINPAQSVNVAPTAGSGLRYAWDATGRTFTDSTPDVALLSMDLLTDHSAAPWGATTPAQAVGVFGGRLAVASGQWLYLSQQVVGAATGLYWNLVNDPDATDFPTQGFAARVGAVVESQRIARLVPFLGDFLLWYEQGRYLLTGSDPGSFSIRPFDGDEGKGLAAVDGLTLAAGGIWYLSQDGLRRFDGSGDRNVSGRIERSIVPAAWNAPGFSGAAYSRAVLGWGGNRLFLALPRQPGDTEPTTLWVWEARYDAWTRWASRTGDALTVGAVLTFGATLDTERVYLCPGDGQIYRVNGTGDTATPGGTPQAITLQVQGRRFAGKFGRRVRANRFGWRIAADAAIPVIWTVSDTAGRAQTFPWTLTAGDSVVDHVKVRADLTDTDITWQLTAAGVVTLYYVQLSGVERG